MRRSAKNPLIAIIVLLSLFSARYIADYIKQPASAKKSATGYVFFVKRVIDGDTIVLSTGERVRYIGINTPEIHHPRKGIEYYGPEAADFNKRLVLGKKVKLEFDAERLDRYGRTLAYVYLEDGTFVNAELLRQGYARTMTIRPNIKYADLFKRLQEEARRQKRGMWAREWAR